MGFAFAPMGLSVLMIITALAIPMALIALGATLLFTNQAIEATTNTSGARVTIANISGFAVFALVMGIIANIGQFTTIGGLAPGIFFFNLD
ncbi:MAG TPA: hypothetical protein VNL15_04565, partial [Dehalococcoidia bacterium]|nr:hypothetical protein [Dehalococcoidia bacterium]